MPEAGIANININCSMGRMSFAVYKEEIKRLSNKKPLYRG